MTAVPAAADPLAITDFLYGQGDLLRGGAASRPPEVAAGPEPDVRQPRRRAHDLPHDHRRAARPATAPRASRTRSRTGRSTSTPASSASARRASRPRRTATPGRRPTTSAPAPTRTSAACIRSCAARSASRGKRTTCASPSSAPGSWAPRWRATCARRATRSAPGTARPRRREALADDGRGAAASIAEAVRGAEVVVTMLADGDAVEAVAGEALAAMDGGGARADEHDRRRGDASASPSAPRRPASRSSTRRCSAPRRPPSRAR